MIRLEKIMTLVDEFGTACVLDELQQTSTQYVSPYYRLRAAIEELLRDVEYQHAHTLVECPHCGFTGAREYEPKEK